MKTTTLNETGIVPESFMERFGTDVTGILSGFDRLRLRGTLRLLYMTNGMAAFLGSILRTNADLIWRNDRGSDYADWLALDAKKPGDPTTPKDLVATAMWKGAVDAMADMAQATGRNEEARRYRAQGQGMAQAFARAFVGAEGTIGNGSQTGHILALHFGLVPHALRDTAARNLVADIRRRGTLLSTGFLGTPYSLDVLATAGEAKLVHDLLLRTEFPSWGYMIAHNATTIWERWNGDAGDRSMNSFNHYALGAVSGFLWRRIAGIDATAPGFAKFRFDPVYDRRMQRGGGRYESRIGLISTKWAFDAVGGYSLDIVVPTGSEALVVLPTTRGQDVSKDGLPLDRRLQAEAATGERIAVSLYSGRHAFRVRNAQF